MSYIFIFLTPIINILLLELYSIRPKFFYFSLVLVNLIIIYSIKKLSEKKLLELELWNLAILPISFVSSIMLYSTLLTNNISIQILFITTLIFTHYYLKNVYFRKKEKEGRKDFFENISSYGNFLVLFFTSASAYGLKSFLNTPIWILILMLAIIIALMVYESLWANKISMKRGGIYIFLSCLVLIQIAWSIYFLPLNYNTLGLILAICYYILIGAIKYFLRSNLNRKTVKLYLIFGFLSIILILLTAKWV